MSVFSDLVALAKAGYTPAQVKEIMAMSSNEADNVEQTQKAAEITQKDAVQPEQQTVEDTANKEMAEPDQIEKLQQQVDSLQKQLAAAQKENSTKDVSTPPADPQEVLSSIIRDFM